MNCPETPTERVAVVVWYLAHGMALHICEVQKLTALRPRQARDLMQRLSRVLPIYRDDGGVWRVCR